jgi:heme exporter protein D
LSDFFAMGGYAAFVWPAYGLAALILFGLLLQSWWAARRGAAEFERLRGQLRPARPSRPRLGPVVRRAAGAQGPADASGNASA